MSSTFLDAINVIIDARDGGGGDNSTETCETKINHYQFYQLSLIPAVLITLSFAITKNRRNLLLSLWNGRPGLIFPMDTLTRSSRISYACGFGATAFLVYEIVLEQKYAINYTDGNRAVKSFVAIGSMFIYGMVFFPLFASLSIGSVYSYTMGALYVWMLTSVQIYRIFECDAAATEAKVMLLLRTLPSMLCLLYLSVSLPVRMVAAFRRGQYFTWRDDNEETNTLSDIRASYHGHHVTKLFQKPRMKLGWAEGMEEAVEEDLDQGRWNSAALNASLCLKRKSRTKAKKETAEAKDVAVYCFFRPAETTKGRILSILQSLVHRLIYQRKRGFRYPARIISVLLTAVLVIYTLTFEMLSVFPPWIDLYRDGIADYIDTELGWEEAPFEDDYTTDERELLKLALWILNVVRICVIVSTVMATVCALLNVLHSLSSYRANLFALYRGDYSHLPPPSTSSNTSHCISSIKYAGFQVGYIIWSYVIQLMIFLILAFLLAIFITLIKYEFTSWLILLLEFVWPILLTVVMVMTIQYVLARFVFLQERGLYLALDNRGVYFNFTYFMFFYNIFLGLASCVLRILKAMLLGIVFLSRLDNSTLSRRFEFFDPGFKAYVGYMHLEAAHTHPVMIVFCRLMLLGLDEKRNRKMTASTPGEHKRSGSSTSERMELVMRNNRVQKNPYGNDFYNNAGDHDHKATTTTTTTAAASSDITDTSDEKRRRRVAARFNWHVTYTLLHNPDIRVMRKGYLQMLRQARLLGVHVPASDRLGDDNIELLQERLADAKEKLNPSSKRNSGDRDDDVDEEDLKEVVTAVEKGEVKKAMSVSSAGVLVAQVNSLVTADAQEGSSSSVPAEPVKGRSADDDPQSPSVENQHQAANTSEREVTRDKELGDLVPESDYPEVEMSRDFLHGGRPGQDSPQGGERQNTSGSPSKSKKYVSTVRV